MEELPEDFYVNQFAFTKELYRDVYPAVDPENESLSQKGKVVVITGASQGIGQKVWHNIYMWLRAKPVYLSIIADFATGKGFAASFAKAGVKALYLTGRSIPSLQDTKRLVQSLNPIVTVITKVVDVQDGLQIKELFEQIKSDYGKADVLVNNAGCNMGGPLATTPISNIWTDFVSRHNVGV
jgi:NADP-dependent 3-hydroxy acid dehydrogenase YdfG